MSILISIVILYMIIIFVLVMITKEILNLHRTKLF